MDWRDIESEVFTLLIKGVALATKATVAIAALLFAVGETVEHFTP